MKSIVEPAINKPDVMLFPVNFAEGDGHWALIIHDSRRNGGVTLFADSFLTTPSRLEDNPQIKKVIQRTIEDIFGKNSMNIQPCTVEQQQDKINCGAFTCIFAESYLLHGDLNTRITGVDQRERILRNLQHIHSSDDDQFEPFFYNPPLQPANVSVRQRVIFSSDTTKSSHCDPDNYIPVRKHVISSSNTPKSIHLANATRVWIGNEKMHQVNVRTKLHSIVLPI